MAAAAMLGRRALRSPLLAGRAARALCRAPHDAPSPPCTRSSAAPPDPANSNSDHSEPPCASTARVSATSSSATELAFWSCPHTWSRASKNTLRCLVGCSIGDFSTLFYLQSLGTPPEAAMAAAMVGGIATSLCLETVVLRTVEGFGWRVALRTAFNMSFVSMCAMELTESAVALYLTGGQFDVTSAASWASLVPSSAAGFLAPLPYNYYQIKRHGRSCH